MEGAVGCLRKTAWNGLKEDFWGERVAVGGRGGTREVMYEGASGGGSDGAEASR